MNERTMDTASWQGRRRPLAGLQGHMPREICRRQEGPHPHTQPHHPRARRPRAHCPPQPEAPSLGLAVAAADQALWGLRGRLQGRQLLPGTRGSAPQSGSGLPAGPDLNSPPGHAAPTNESFPAVSVGKSSSIFVCFPTSCHSRFSWVTDQNSPARTHLFKVICSSTLVGLPMLRGGASGAPGFPQEAPSEQG